MYRQEGAGLRARTTISRFDGQIALRERVWKGQVEQELPREDKSGEYDYRVPARHCDYREWRQRSTLRG